MESGETVNIMFVQTVYFYEWRSYVIVCLKSENGLVLLCIANEFARYLFSVLFFILFHYIEINYSIIEGIFVNIDFIIPMKFTIRRNA